MATKELGAVDRLKEQRNGLAQEHRLTLDRIASENREITPAERAHLYQIEARMDDINEQLTAASGSTVTAIPDRGIRSSFHTYARMEPRGYRHSFIDYLANGDNMSTRSRDILMERRAQLDAAERRDARTSELRAQGVGTGSAGGFLVPQGYLRQISEVMKAYGGLMAHATVLETPTGNTMPWPTNDDTANVGSILGENTQVTEVDLTLGSRQLNAWTYTSNLVLISRPLIQDQVFDIDAFISNVFGRRIGRATAAHFATGTGTNQPIGITNGIRVGVTGATGETTSISYADIVNLVHSVNPAYRYVDPAKGPGAANQNKKCGFLVGDAGLAMLERLTRTDGTPMLQPLGTSNGFQGPAPRTLLGWPVWLDPSLPSPGPSVVGSILFGDLAAGYVVRQVAAVEVVRLQERYIDSNQTGFIGLARFDGRPNDPQAIAAFQNSAT